MQLAHVRLASRAAALTLAALLLAVASRSGVRSDAVSEGAPAIAVVVELAPSPSPAPPRRIERATPRAVTAPGAGPASLRLWRYSASGQIVFAREEHYRRCLAARAQRREEADCPNAIDSRELVLAASL